MTGTRPTTRIAELPVPLAARPHARGPHHLRRWPWATTPPSSPGATATPSSTPTGPASAPSAPSPTTPDGEQLVGFGYGYLVEPGQWWHDQVRAALDRRTAKKWLPGAFEVCELHVHPDHQSQGLGRQLLHALVADLPHPAALLSTPGRRHQGVPALPRRRLRRPGPRLPLPRRRTALRHPRRPAAAAPREPDPATAERDRQLRDGRPGRRRRRRLGPQRPGRGLLPGPRRPVGRGRGVRRRPRRRRLHRRALARRAGRPRAPARTSSSGTAASSRSSTSPPTGCATSTAIPWGFAPAPAPGRPRPRRPAAGLLRRPGRHLRVDRRRLRPRRRRRLPAVRRGVGPAQPAPWSGAFGRRPTPGRPGPLASGRSARPPTAGRARRAATSPSTSSAPATRCWTAGSPASG